MNWRYFLTYNPYPGRNPSRIQTIYVCTGTIIILTSYIITYLCMFVSAFYAVPFAYLLCQLQLHCTVDLQLFVGISIYKIV